MKYETFLNALLFNMLLIMHMGISLEGSFINYVGKLVGLAKCQHYYINICSKLVNEGGGNGDKIPENPVNVVYEWPL